MACGARPLPGSEVKPAGLLVFSGPNGATASNPVSGFYEHVKSSDHDDPEDSPDRRVFERVVLASVHLAAVVHVIVLFHKRFV